MPLTRRTILVSLPLLAIPARAETDAKQRLIAAYPAFLDRATANAIVWRDGTLMAWDDGLTKSFEQKLADACLDDQMSLAYPRGPQLGAPPPDFDPGRFRNLAFFKKMYGADTAEVQSNLASVPWHIGSYRGSLPFTRINGVDRIAAAVVADLAALPAALHPYLEPPAGSFAWRPIAGTETLSAHSFGIAVDINTNYSDYWRWRRGGWRNRIPYPIVEVFERHGFIWGGKWSHYDTMHFEYRPELLT
jgi:hypothetical protein